MRGLVVLLGVLTCEVMVGPTCAAPASAATSQEVLAENERAREKFRLGVNAYRAERLDEARQLLTEAWRLRRTYDVAAALAQVEDELGHHARAAELLDFCLNNFAPIESDTKFQQLRQAFDEVRKRVGQIDFTAVPPGTEVRVDDEFVGTTPLDVSTYLQPGLHEFVFRMGDRTLRRSLLVQAEEQHRILLEPQPEKTESSSASTQRRAAVAAGMRTAPTGTHPTFPYYIGGALLVAGVTTGIVFHVAASDASGRADELNAQHAVSDCSAKGATSTELCRNLADANSERVFNRNLAIFGYSVAATAAIAMAIYWLWPESDRTATAASPRSLNWSVGYEPSRVWLSTGAAFP
jgi:hypothetical protein